MTNFDLYRLLNFVAGKDVYAQTIGTDEFDVELKSKNLRHFRKRLGLPENYAPGMIGVSATRLTDTDLMPFFIEGDYIVPSNTGIVALDDWYYILDFYSSVSRSSCIISHQETSNRLNNALTKPTTKDLAAYMVKVGLRVFPHGIDGVDNVHVMYYRRPIDPVFMTTVNETTYEIEYDTVNSVELEWDDGSKLDILHMILADFGFTVERQDLSGYANKLVEAGK